MDDPRSELMADPDERSSVPDFDALTPPSELVRGERTRDDFLDAVLGIDEPATASDVADLAGHGVDAAREYLDWFERLGVVTRVTESPATYERNQEYLKWRRVETLRTEYPTDELVDLLQTHAERAEEFEAEFDATSPDAVSITGHAATADQSIEEVWERLSAWRTARRRVRLLERALATASDDTADSRSAV
jgi:hypothetical protein